MGGLPSGEGIVANPDQQDSRELGYYFALAQVGLEMAAPLLLGAWLDRWLEWGPWGLIGGAVMGFAGGLFHLVSMVQSHDAKQKKPPEDRTS
jgi:ATP synthase protein I